VNVYTLLRKKMVRWDFSISTGRFSLPVEIENFFAFLMLGAEKPVNSRFLCVGFSCEKRERREKSGFRLCEPCGTECFFVVRYVFEGL